MINVTVAFARGAFTDRIARTRLTDLLVCVDRLIESSGSSPALDESGLLERAEPSGQQVSRGGLCADDLEHPQVKRWSRFAGRWVDLMVRNLLVMAGASTGAVVDALWRWLAVGAQL